MIGQTFNRLTVLGERFHVARTAKREPRGYISQAHRVCRCECGTISVIPEYDLKKGSVKSCGCLVGTYHGQSRTKLYNVWMCMLRRCQSKTDPRYRLYGARGITVCQAWQSFIGFKAWATGYKPGLEIDRKDNDGNYEPANCRWVTRQQNSDNRRDTIWVTAFGERKTFSTWLKDPRCKVAKHTLYRRIVQLGWEAETALSTPISSPTTKRKTATQKAALPKSKRSLGKRKG